MQHQHDQDWDRVPERPGRETKGPNQRSAKQENPRFHEGFTLLGYLDSNQEWRYQKPLCCQLHHTPMDPAPARRTERLRYRRSIYNANHICDRRTYFTMAADGQRHETRRCGRTPRNVDRTVEFHAECQGSVTPETGGTRDQSRRGEPTTPKRNPPNSPDSSGLAASMDSRTSVSSREAA